MQDYFTWLPLPGSLAIDPQNPATLSRKFMQRLRIPKTDLARQWVYRPQASSYASRSAHAVQTVRRCPNHCSFCSVSRTDGQQPRQRTAELVIHEIVELRRLGYRFIALADRTAPAAATPVLSEKARGERPLSITRLAAAVRSDQLRSVGTRRRNSSKKFSRNATLVNRFDSIVPSAYRTAARRLPSGATS